MLVRSNARFLSVTSNQWHYLAFMILAVLPLVLVLTFAKQVYDWFLVQVVEPRAEQALGFRGGEIFVTENGETYKVFAVTTVTKGGPFERAGVQPGDIPYGYVHGIQPGFIGHLNDARGRSVELRFVNRNTIGKGACQPRHVQLFVPIWSNL